MASRKKTGSGRSGKTTTKRKTTASRAGKQKAKMPGFLPKEILILLSVALALLLFFSNLHMCGAFGEVLYQVMRGCFGSLAFVVPFAFLAGMLFYCANRGNGKAMWKLAAASAVFLLLCGLCQLFASGGFQEYLSYGDYYDLGQTGFNGGFAGGLLCKTLVPMLGTIGTGVVLVILTVICGVVISERSIVEPIEKKSTQLYETAKEDAIRRKEEYAAAAEERKKARLEKKVQGVALDTGLKKAARKEEAKKQEAALEQEEFYSQESFFEPKITGMVEEDEYEKLLRQFDQAEPVSASADQDTIVVRKDTRTLVELEAIDSLKGTLGDSFGREYHETSIKPVFGSVQKEQDVLDFSRSGLQKAGESRLSSASFQEEEVREISGTGEMRDSGQESGLPWREEDADTIRVMTSSGKVIEAEKTESIFRSTRNPSGSSGKTFSSAPGSLSQLADAKKQPAQPVLEPVKKKPAVPRKHVFPPASLLKSGGKQGTGSRRTTMETAKKLEQTLQNFGVGVKVTNISCGPSVTRYELQPETGVRVNRITALADDIKLSLAAEDIRIEAPIPGRAAVGIEVPNKENQTVYFRDIMDTEAFRKHPSKVTFAVGRDIGGQSVITDLARMPHLLIAGATGSGKSICINTLIMSILYKASPEQVKLIMIDPKVVELGIYNGIPNLMIPVVTDPKKASGALKWAVAEMTDRYKRFADMNVRDLSGYNEKMREAKAHGDENARELPMIVIIVDEFADLMMVAPGEVEDSVCRLAQMARAAGLHLVLATQRPSVNVITGLIKANVPSRIALSVSSGVDSRTIIDMNGAEKLLGKGDMLFYPSGMQNPVRVQGAYISDSEIEKVVNFLKEKNGAGQYDEDMESRMALAEEGEAGGSGESDRDEYFVQAGRYVIEKQKASIGMLQRALKIGFNRAARIMDQLHEAGVVGPEEGTKPRQIYMTMADFESYVEATE